jgi:hypothetical protein
MPLNPDQFGLFQSPNPPRAANRGPLQSQYSDTVKSGGKGTSQHLSDIDRVLAESSPSGRERTAFPGWEEGAADFDRAEAELKDEGHFTPDNWDDWDEDDVPDGRESLDAISQRMRKNVYRDVMNSEQPLTSPRQLESGTQHGHGALDQLTHLRYGSRWPEGFEISQREYDDNRRASLDEVEGYSAPERTQVFDNFPSATSLNDLEALDWQLETFGHALAPNYFQQTVADHQDYEPEVAIFRGLKSLHESRPDATDDSLMSLRGDPEVEDALDRGYQTVFPNRNFSGADAEVSDERIRGMWRQLQQRGERRKQGDGGNQ